METAVLRRAVCMMLNNKTIMRQSVLKVMRDIAIHLNKETQECY